MTTKCWHCGTWKRITHLIDREEGMGKNYRLCGDCTLIEDTHTQERLDAARRVFR